MKNINFFPLIIILTQAIEQSHHVLTIENDNYILIWDVNIENQTISISLDVNITDGWVGFGVSNDGSMINSDMVVCYSYQEEYDCTDRWAIDFSEPKLDTDQDGKSDLTQITRTLGNERTQFNFTRLLQTGDSRDIQILKNKYYYILFAIGTLDKDNQIRRHDQTGVHTIILWDGTKEIVTNYSKDNDTYEMQLGFKNFIIPKRDSSYICRMFNISSMAAQQTGMNITTTYHATSFETHIDYFNVIDQVIIYSCNSRVKQQEGNFDCLSLSKSDCFNIDFVGGNSKEIIVYPQNAGVIWGSWEQQIAVLQIHYLNEGLQDLLVDQSAISVFYTPTLREYDIGISLVGANNDRIFIPAFSNSSEIEDTCDSECSQIPQDPITLVNSFFHGHKRLKKIQTKILYSNQIVDETSMRMDEFNSSNQQVIQFKTPIVLVRGYQLLTLCNYDNSGNDQDVNGGVGSHNERCQNYITYYPKASGFLSCGESLGCNLFPLANRQKVEIISNYIPNQYELGESVGDDNVNFNQIIKVCFFIIITLIV